MKIQDIIFIAALLILIWKKNPKYIVWAGLVSLIVSIPLFAFWKFYTAQHFAYYAGGFFLLAILWDIVQLLYENRS